MDDELENFIKEHKARVAEDKVILEQDPPYMEIKVCLNGPGSTDAGISSLNGVLHQYRCLSPVKGPSK
uniref:Uncharacterized protein n=1 Tax=Monopterus albus TaxID=43700 RepID=A0A3Q3JHF1_MONAL